MYATRAILTVNFKLVVKKVIGNKVNRVTQTQVVWFIEGAADP